MLIHPVRLLSIALQLAVNYYVQAFMPLKKTQRYARLFPISPESGFGPESETSLAPKGWRGIG